MSDEKPDSNRAAMPCSVSLTKPRERMSRDERDWPAVRTVASARMKELNLTVSEVARKAKMAESTVRGFLGGRSRPHGITLSGLDEGLGLPAGYLRGVADGQKPESVPTVTAVGRVSDEGKTAFAPTLSLMDVGQGAQKAADYRAYVSMVARELSDGMTREQRSAASRFLSDLSSGVLCQ
jgi:transcriptional regulator with XRE-family HTH domain